MSSRLLDLKKDPVFTGLIAIAGVVAGVGLWILTAVLSRLHISGNGWSLAGNGALIVPFGLGPAIVAGGWAAIVLRMRGHPRWLQLGIFGPRARDAGATASLFFGFLLYGWLLASAITAAMIPAPDPARPGPPFWSIAAILLLPVTLIGGCEAAAAVLPG